MKPYLVLIALALVVFVGLFFLPNITTFEQTGVATSTPEKVIEDQLQIEIDAAKEEATPRVEAEAQKEYQEKYESLMAEVENAVIDDFQARLDARKASNTKKIIGY